MIATIGKKKVEESFRDRLATMDAEGRRKWVYAQKPKGRLYNFRTWLSVGYFIVFFGLPFIQIDGRPLFLFNVTKAKFILFEKFSGRRTSLYLALG